MRPIASWIAGAFVGVAILAGQAGAADLFIADTVTDLGVEPNTGASTTTSPDIWIRRSPDPNYNPAPFNAGRARNKPHVPRVRAELNRFDLDGEEMARAEDDVR